MDQSVRRKETVQSIGSVVPAILRQARQRHGTLRAIQRRWGTLVGKRLARHTAPVSLRRGRLVIHVDRPGDNFELSYQKQELLQRLKTTTQERVEELVIRPGEIALGMRAGKCHS